MKSVLSDRHFHDEAAAYKFVEARIWPNGAVCPHCGGMDRISPMKGKSTRVGTYKCYQCRKPFTVKVGTVFEASHVPMRHWLQAIFLLSSSKKGISSNQLSRTLGCTLKTAWFISHRIREAMRITGVEPLGGADKIVEADETYFGEIENPNKVSPSTGKRYRNKGSGGANKRTVVSLVERGGSVRSFHVANAKGDTVRQVVLQNISTKSQLQTDESVLYRYLGGLFEGGHGTVTHSQDEYVRGNDHTNTVEGFFSVFKRGMKGTYQHCAEKHLHRYLAEFDFRYNTRVALGVNDVARADCALKGIVGKRLTYETTQKRD